jgi:hypothetical protein
MGYLFQTREALGVLVTVSASTVYANTALRVREPVRSYIMVGILCELVCCCL